MRTFLVAGSPEGRLPVGLLPAAGDRVIAVDRGAAHAKAWGWPVHLLIGDLDSLPMDDVEALAAQSTPMVTAPVAKDETDLELGLLRALTDGAQEIVICAALGGRADHMLANVLLLTRPEMAGLEVCIADGNQIICILRSGESMTLSGTAGDLVSLLPIGGDAEGITTIDLAYPLHDETLRLGQPRGISNVLQGETAQVSLRRGLLLVVQTKICE